MTAAKWTVRLGAEAEKDFVGILRYTANAFGERQARIYKTTLVEALAALAEGPNPPGSLSRADLLPNLRSLHVARNGKRGRHFIMYREKPERIVEVVRILHDTMDFARHIPHEAT